MADVIKVDIWSDIQCPWCYIGKRRFEAGVAASAAPVEVEYHSFELAPDTPLDFVGSPTDYLVQRKGIPRERAVAMNDHVTQLAAEVGLEYHLDRAKQVNTVRAHELLHFAKASGRQLELVERLFRAYFTESRNLGSVAELVSLAADVGLDPGQAEQVLTARTYLGAVKADVRQAARYGIQGVPFFVINDEYGVAGAQPAETFAMVLTQIGAQKRAQEGTQQQAQRGTSA
ncbi:MAG: DsbA family oxidoreductase [Micromonosporaceae bacterium]|nr:DsbA family oxidoreductase [Micromonosporaceae bacterium]